MLTTLPQATRKQRTFRLAVILAVGVEGGEYCKEESIVTFFSLIWSHPFVGIYFVNNGTYSVRLYKNFCSVIIHGIYYFTTFVQLC